MLRGQEEGHRSFDSRVEDGIAKAVVYEDELSQALAASLMPLERLEQEADCWVSLSAEMGEELLVREEALTRGLLTWFKQEFFAWVDRPVCGYCDAQGTTRMVGHSRPAAMEAEHLASVVEVYVCSRCGAQTRFPRYNSPIKLLETRRGRCGEWANAFTLCCAAAGLRARQALDWTDHVWTEVWIPDGPGAAVGRWVHADPCEAALDTPLLYESGWGKGLSYVLSVDTSGVGDVSRRYTRDWGAMLRRRTLVSEDWLRRFLHQRTAGLRAGLSEGELARLQASDARETEQLAGVPAAPAVGILPGRQSGSAHWVAGRGEGGGDAAGSGGVAGAPPPRPPLRYCLAGDEGVSARLPGRLTGGAVRGSGGNGAAEGAVRAFDGNPGTKWLDFGGGVAGGMTWLEYRLRRGEAGVKLRRYTLTSGNDAPERDPRSIVVEGRSESAGEAGWEIWDTDWAVLDEQADLFFPARAAVLCFPIPEERQAQACTAFRLRIQALRDGKTANAVQLSCWDLFV